MINAKSHLRSIAKTISWRTIAAVDTLCATLIATHDINTALKVGGAIIAVEVVTKSFLYYMHERMWTSSRIARMFGNA
jgi:uncharacterized membrane protein